MKFSKRPDPLSLGGIDDGPLAVDTGNLDNTRPMQLRPVPGGREDALATVPTGHTLSEPLEERGAEPTFTAYSVAPPPAWPVWLAAIAVAVLWALGPIAFALGYRAKVAPLQDDMFAISVFALLAIGPAAFVFAAAYMIRQGQKLAFEVDQARAMANDMLAPALVAAARAGDVSVAIRSQIESAGTAAATASETLSQLREALAFETDKLTGVTAQSVRTAHELTETMSRERAQMSALAQNLDAQTAKITEAVVQQAQAVSEAARSAETQFREAGGILAERSTELAVTANAASGAARAAGEDLTRHIARLETAGVGITEQVRAVEGGMATQRAALATLGQALKADSQAFSLTAEAQVAKLDAFVKEAHQATEKMRESADTGSETLRAMVSDAALQFRDLADTAKAEREEFSLSTLNSLDTFASAASGQRTQLESQTRAAIDALAEAAEQMRSAVEGQALRAREQVDQLSEAAFAAGQQANQVFESRLEEARALVAESSRMVEDAGVATAKQLDASAAAARANLLELTAMLDTLEARTIALPHLVEGEAERIRKSVDDGLNALMTQARQTAAEAGVADARLQDRVNANLGMASESMPIQASGDPMRAVGTSASQPYRIPPDLPIQRLSPRTSGDQDDIYADETELVLDSSGAQLAERLGLRSRIRLTPIATDMEFSAVFDAAGGVKQDPQEEAASGSWTWKDLLASLDGSGDEIDALQADLGSRLREMGVDPEALIPAGRVDEICAGLQAGVSEQAREIVRRCAPAATRRIARRLLTDDDVKRQARLYLHHYHSLLGTARSREAGLNQLSTFLTSEGGRIFLLIDAAAGDMI